MIAGENVSTTEVETMISTYCSFKDAVVYGVEIPENEGKAGMVAISDPEGVLNLESLSKGIIKSLPAYARPLFLRVLSEMDVTGMLLTYGLQLLTRTKLQSAPISILPI